MMRKTKRKEDDDNDDDDGMVKLKLTLDRVPRGSKFGT